MLSMPVHTQAGIRLTADVYETPGGETYVLEIPLPGVKPEEIVIEADSYSLDTRAFVRPVSSPLSEAVPLNS